MRGFSIGTLAKSSGVGIDTVRHYERVGLLASPSRTASGYRSYGEKDVERLRFIRRGRDLGFSLAELATLLELYASGRARSADVLAMTQGKITRLQAQIHELAELEAALTHLAERCQPALPAAECPILTHLVGLGRRDDPASTG